MNNISIRQYRRFSHKEHISSYGSLNAHQRNALLLSDQYIKKFITLSFAEKREVSAIELQRLTAQLISPVKKYIISKHGNRAVHNLNKFKIPAISSVEFHEDGRTHLHIGTTRFSDDANIDYNATLLLVDFLNTLIKSDRYGLAPKYFNLSGTGATYLDPSRLTLIDSKVQNIEPYKFNILENERWFDEPISTYILKQRKSSIDPVIFISPAFQNRIEKNNCTLNRIFEKGLKRTDRWVLQTNLLRFIPDKMIYPIIRDVNLIKELQKWKRNKERMEFFKTQKDKIMENDTTKYEANHLETADEFLTRAAAIEFNEEWHKAHSNAHSKRWQDAGAIVISSSYQLERSLSELLGAA